MDRVIENLSTILRDQVADYTNVRDWKGKSYFLENAADNTYSVIFLPDADHPDDKPSIIVMAHLVGEQVMIDEDITDRPLYQELLRCGIPREQIILAYAGETRFTK